MAVSAFSLISSCFITSGGFGGGFGDGGLGIDVEGFLLLDSEADDVELLRCEFAAIGDDGVFVDFGIALAQVGIAPGNARETQRNGGPGILATLFLDAVRVSAEADCRQNGVDGFLFGKEF